MARRSPRPADSVDLMLEQWHRECPDLDVSGLAVFGRLHRTFNRYQAQLNRLFDEFGVNMAAFGVLAALRRAAPPHRLTAGALADTNLLSTGGITQRVDRLENAGLVRRERDPDDRRIVYIGLTDEGLELTDRVTAAHFANEVRMLRGLTQAERTQLADLLSSLERSLDQAEREARAEADGAR